MTQAANYFGKNKWIKPINITLGKPQTMHDLP